MNYFDTLEKEISGYKNSLLGYYNIKNEYTINPEIISKLIEEPKTIENMTKDKIECSCYITGFGSIFFEILINVKEDKCYTDLYIIENVSKINGYKNDVERTLIAKYDSKVDREYFKKVIYAFNLHSDSDEMEEPNIEDVHKSYIYARKDFNEKMFIAQRANYNKAVKTVFDAQISYLKKNKNAFSKEVLDSFKKYEKELGKEYLKSGKSVDDFAMFELLNLCIQEVLMNNPEFKSYYDNYIKSLNVTVEAALKIIKEYNRKYVQDLKKKKDIELSQNLLKIIANSEKLKNGEMNKNDNVVCLGMLNHDNVYEVNSLEQLKALNNKQYEKYLKLQNEERKLIERMYENISFEGETIFENIIDMCLDVINVVDFADIIPDSVEEFRENVLNVFDSERQEINDLVTSKDELDSLRDHQHVSFVQQTSPIENRYDGPVND